MNGNVTLKWVLIGFLIFTAAPLKVFAQSSANEGRTFSQEELDKMLAPIALYPDSLLAQILVAATYPNEVLEADRWVKQSTNLTREALNNLLDKQDWDLSVKALVPFPQVLAMMTEKIDWTESVGDAFLAQEEEVVDTIQTLRARARAQGHLYDTGEQRVTAKDDIIQIEPVNPQLIYIPVYDPCWIYGPWWWPGYPTYCIAPGAVLGFAAGVWVGSAWCHGWGHWAWHHHHHHHHHDRHHHRHQYLITNVNRHLNINRDFPVHHIQTSVWRHDPNRRGNITHRSTVSRQPVGQGTVVSPERRREFRGHDGRVVTERGSAETVRRGPRAPKGGAGRRPTGDSTFRTLQQRGGGNVFEGSGAHGRVRQQSERGATSRGSAGGGLHGGGHTGGAQGRGSHSGGGFKGGGFHGGGLRK